MCLVAGILRSATKKTEDNDMLTRKFCLEGLECACRIGAYDYERLAPQLENTLNYDVIRGSILDIAGEQHFDLQETLARRIFDALASQPGVTGVRIRTAKPDAYDDCRQISYELSSLPGSQV